MDTFQLAHNNMLAPKHRIFLVGHNKSGSRSLHHFFMANGLRSVHFDQGRLAVTMDRNRMLGRPLLEGYERFEAFGDMESIHHGEHCPYRSSIASVPGRILHAYLWFELLDLQYPDSLFVYNTRPMADWLESRLQHASGFYAESYRHLLCLNLGKDDLSLSELRLHWAKDLRRHEHNLRSYFGDSKRFIELNLSDHNFGDHLAEFLEGHAYAISSRTVPKIGSRHHGIS